MGLTVKNIAFIEAYMSNGGNGTEAYKKAYGQKVKDNSARSQAAILLAKPNVSEAIKERQQILAKKFQIDREYLIRELLEIIESSKEEGYDGAGVIKDRKAWNDAVKTLAKIMGFDQQKIEHSGQIDMNHSYSLKFPGTDEIEDADDLIKILPEDIDNNGETGK